MKRDAVSQKQRVHRKLWKKLPPAEKPQEIGNRASVTASALSAEAINPSTKKASVKLLSRKRINSLYPAAGNRSSAAQNRFAMNRSSQARPNRVFH